MASVDIVGIGPRKTMFVLVIVVGCFSVLWPRVFYPMLTGSGNVPIKPNMKDRSAGCCDVIFESDVNARKIMTELCGNVLQKVDPALSLILQQGHVTKHSVEVCRAEILTKCGIDIAAILNENKVGKSIKQILDEVRSFNSSSCLQINFGVSPWTLGVSHRLRVNLVSDASIRQERPPHLRPDMLHPALRERGRAIPQHSPYETQSPHTVPVVPRIVEGRPGPIPGMRPPMGGAGHVTPAKPASNTMGVLMPLYTIAIIVFFMYTMMKVVFKKPQESNIPYPPIKSDPAFRKRVFGNESIRDVSQTKSRGQSAWTEDTKLGWKDRDTRDTELDQLRRRLLETERAMARIVQQMGQVPLRGQVSETVVEEHSLSNGSLANGSIPKSANTQKTESKIIESEHPVIEPEIQVSSKQELNSEVEIRPRDTSADRDKATVKVLGMEMTASCEGGQKWSRPGTPVLHPTQSTPIQESPPPQSIYLEGALPHHSQLLVSDSESHTEILSTEESENSADPPIVLSGKMTLSLINLDTPVQNDIEHPIRDGEEIEDLDVEIKLDDNDELEEDSVNYTTADALTNNNNHDISVNEEVVEDISEEEIEEEEEVELVEEEIEEEELEDEGEVEEQTKENK